MGVKLHLFCQVRNPGEKKPVMLSLDMAKYTLNSIKDLEDHLLRKLQDRFDPSILSVTCKGPTVMPMEEQGFGCVSYATLEGSSDNFSILAAMSNASRLHPGTKLRPIAFYQVRHSNPSCFDTALSLFENDIV